MKNLNFGQKSKFCSKIGILAKNRNLGKKSKLLLKNLNFGQKSKFCSKIGILAKNGNLGQKSKLLLKNLNFGQKIEILLKNRNFGLKWNLGQKSKLLSEVWILTKDRNFMVKNHVFKWLPFAVKKVRNSDDISHVFFKRCDYEVGFNLIDEHLKTWDYQIHHFSAEFSTNLLFKRPPFVLSIFLSL